jgi:hypothetical protein
MSAKTIKNESSSESSTGSEVLEIRIARLELWALIFGVIVVLGVAGQSFFGVWIWWNNRKLTDVQKVENTRLVADIAQANARAEEAKRAAAEAELELERLKKRVAPRHIDRDAFFKALDNNPPEGTS